MGKAFVVLCMLMYMQYSHAQTFLSVQYEIAEPTETFRNAAGTGSGVRAAYMHFISQRVALAGSVGYIRWGARSGTPSSTEYKFVSTPVHLGVDFLLSRGVIAPYLGLSVGMDYLRMRAASPITGIYSDQSALKFGFKPHVGIGIHVAGPIGLNFAGSYNVIYTEGTPSKYFGLNAGLAVGL